MIIEQVFEKKQSMVIYTANELAEMLDEGRLVLREVNTGQVREIRRYILDNILEEQIYMPPIIAMLPEGSLDEGKPKKLTIIDGTQRMQALTRLRSAITRMTGSDDMTEQKKGFGLFYMLDQVQVAVQVFEGLSQKEADQLYIDLNTKGKKVSLSKRISFDSRDEVSQTTNKVLENHEQLKVAGVEMEKTAVVRPRNKNLLSLSQLRRIVALFITGKLTDRQIAMSAEDQLQSEQHIELISTWFDELFTLYPAKTIGNFEESMLASFPLLSALAQYAYEGLEHERFEVKKETVERRMRGLAHVDWARNQEIWRTFDGSVRGKDRYYYLRSNKKTNDALVGWLRSEGGE
ncbi:DNA sulfur modification protein DndB [Sporosarcina cascadiensis]|uniref:DNA sulfur modification protein DndB n=1 Tax=Sporosarcina cascadiensis TaxID=2660747 RepID=UPI00129AE0D8|nr:DNA sulfur modification protein DndB [Sporosarcina cascadiensis]